MVVDETLLDSAHDQIALRLAKLNGSSDAITASFAYIDGGVLGSFTTFPDTVNIFNGETFTRAEFEAIAITTPEPSSVLLLSCGLIILKGFFRRHSG